MCAMPLCLMSSNAFQRICNELYKAKRMRRPMHFNKHRSQLIGSSFFCYNSPAAAAREVFKPSTDAKSLLGSIKKNFFDLGEGFAWERLAKWGCFRFLDLL